MGLVVLGTVLVVWAVSVGRDERAHGNAFSSSTPCSSAGNANPLLSSTAETRPAQCGGSTTRPRHVGAGTRVQQVPRALIILPSCFSSFLILKSSQVLNFDEPQDNLAIQLKPGVRYITTLSYGGHGASAFLPFPDRILTFLYPQRTSSWRSRICCISASC